MEVAGKFCSEMGLEIDHTKCGNRITTGTKSAHIFLKKPYHWQLQASIQHVLLTSQPHY
jgi:hypothetical protein